MLLFFPDAALSRIRLWHWQGKNQFLSIVPWASLTKHNRDRNIAACMDRKLHVLRYTEMSGYLLSDTSVIRSA